MTPAEPRLRMVCYRLDVPAGIERAFGNLVDALLAEGLEVEVLVLRGAPSKHVILSHPNLKVRCGLTAWRAQFRGLLQRRTRASGIDIIVGLWAMMLWLPMWIRPRRPTIVWEHSLVAERLPNDERLRKVGRILMWLFGRADRVVCVSDATRRFLSTEGVRDELLVVVPNIVEDTLVRPGRPAADPVRLIGMHRMTPLKNTMLSVRALALLGERFELTLLGDGVDRATAEQLARDLGVEQRVHFGGFIDEPIGELLAHDVLLHPSLSETFCLAAFEAAAASVPVVCLTEGSLTETVPAFVVGARAANSSADAFARAIEQAVALCGRDDLFTAALQRRRETMSSGAVVREWSRVLAGV
ncbi:MAG: glycosyltransferase [Acidimicrobiales bacterium]|nr:glycosyltransferase [Acidimicrobiales bacterium]